MTYPKAVAYMESLRFYGWRLGNARMEAFLERLGNPHRQLRVLHVTGTNGKGSTTALIAAILQAAGYRVGAYFSPYVFDLRERIQINSQLIPPEDFARWVEQCRPHIERLRDTEYGQVTEFELKTGLAFAYFAEQAVDFAVMEVGLGGRLDATNVIVPEVSLITAVGLDHTDRLGPTHADIAYEKAGILKPARPLILGEVPPVARAMVLQLAQRRAAPLLLIEKGEKESHEKGGSQTRIAYSSLASPTDSALRVLVGGSVYDLYPRLLGAYQRSNVACAVAAIHALRKRGFPIPDSAIKAGVQQAWLPGRLQVVQRRPWLVLEGAHNADAAEAVAQTLPRLFPYKRLLLVLGMLKPHEPQGVLTPLLPLASRVFFTAPQSERAYSPFELLECASRLREGRYQVVTPVVSAVRAALQTAKPDDLVLVTGSFYVVGECKELERDARSLQNAPCGRE